MWTLGILGFFPELIIIVVVALMLLILCLFYLPSIIRNTFGAAALLFAWAMRAGFIGFVVYIAAWVFMFPVMAVLCCVAGLARTRLEVRAAREAKRARKLVSASMRVGGDTMVRDRAGARAPSEAGDHRERHEPPALRRH